MPPSAHSLVVVAIAQVETPGWIQWSQNRQGSSIAERAQSKGTTAPLILTHGCMSLTMAAQLHCIELNAIPCTSNEMDKTDRPTPHEEPKIETMSTTTTMEKERKPTWLDFSSLFCHVHLLTAVCMLSWMQTCHGNAASSPLLRRKLDQKIETHSLTFGQNPLWNCICCFMHLSQLDKV